MQAVYVETSVVSFLRATSAGSVESLERQRITRNWWNLARNRYELVTSQYVIDEAAKGSAALAAERLRHLAGIPLVPLSDRMDEVAARIMQQAILPPDAIVDALHIACAAVSCVDYLVTWHCSHIANPMILPRVFRTLDDFGLPFPVICAPGDMFTEEHDEAAS